MAEGQLKPVKIPRYIKDNLFFEVPLTDCRFASKLLADIKYATDLYKIIKENKLSTLK
jgi:hypothetical protein